MKNAEANPSVTKIERPKKKKKVLNLQLRLCCGPLSASHLDGGTKLSAYKLFKCLTSLLKGA